MATKEQTYKKIVHLMAKYIHDGETYMSKQRYIFSTGYDVVEDFYYEAEIELHRSHQKDSDGYYVPGDNDIIKDGFGSAWSAWCCECGRKTMCVVRPGKAQCNYCG